MLKNVLQGDLDVLVTEQNPTAISKRSQLACVASVPIPAERSIGPREGVFAFGTRAGKWDESKKDVLVLVQVIVSLDLYHINYMAIATIVCVYVLLGFNL